MSNLTATEKAARRAARAAFTPVATAAEVKVCSCCGLTYSRPEFLALALPSNGVGESMGMQWRNCSCRSTLVW